MFLAACKIIEAIIEHNAFLESVTYLPQLSDTFHQPLKKSSALSLLALLLPFHPLNMGKPGINLCIFHHFQGRQPIIRSPASRIDNLCSIFHFNNCKVKHLYILSFLHFFQWFSQRVLWGI